MATMEKVRTALSHHRGWLLRTGFCSKSEADEDKQGVPMKMTLVATISILQCDDVNCL